MENLAFDKTTFGKSAFEKMIFGGTINCYAPLLVFKFAVHKVFSSIVEKSLLIYFQFFTHIFIYH